MSWLRKAIKRGRRNIRRTVRGAERITDKFKEKTNLRNVVKYNAIAGALFATALIPGVGPLGALGLAGTGAGLYQNAQLAGQARQEAEQMYAQQRQDQAEAERNALANVMSGQIEGGMLGASAVGAGGSSVNVPGTPMGGMPGMPGIPGMQPSQKQKTFNDIFKGFNDSLR